ncbi:MAG TPA: hypothetical protein VG326_00005, partial [Tepidisphaeraceae bacterium]|nr:hypothetical protein [Tepidisphaeraceae bacterium]
LMHAGGLGGVKRRGIHGQADPPPWSLSDIAGLFVESRRKSDNDSRDHVHKSDVDTDAQQPQNGIA